MCIEGCRHHYWPRLRPVPRPGLPSKVQVRGHSATGRRTWTWGYSQLPATSYFLVQIKLEEIKSNHVTNRLLASSVGENFLRVHLLLWIWEVPGMKRGHTLRLCLLKCITVCPLFPLGASYTLWHSTPSLSITFIYLLRRLSDKITMYLAEMHGIIHDMST